MNAISLVIFAAAVIYGVSAITCPRCTDENDWMSCTGTQDCGGGNDDTCQFIVENNNDRHKVTYHCTHSHNCQEHETQHCDLTVHGHCNFCCDTIASCRTQREGIFDSRVNAVTCPRCTNTNDWTSCTATQACGNGEDGCQFVVENEGNTHKVTYHCTHSQDCQHQTQHCDLSVHGHCEFCCDSIASCTTQREGVFDSLA